MQNLLKECGELVNTKYFEHHFWNLRRRTSRKNLIQFNKFLLQLGKKIQNLQYLKLVFIILTNILFVSIKLEIQA